jgi:hypothetical protein
MVTHQQDSPSRMCGDSLDEAARMLDRSWVSLVGWVSVEDPTYAIYMPPNPLYPRVCIQQLHFGPRVAHCPEPTHVCIVRAPVPLPTRMSLHHLTPSHPPPPLSLA